MRKRGQFSTILMILIIIIIISIILTVFVFIRRGMDKGAEEQINQNITNETDTVSTNQTTDNETANQTNINQSVTNQTIDPNIIPNPTGSITYIERKNSEGYYCNGSIDPEHEIRVYTYKLIEGIKVLSDNYIQSEKVTQVCNSYSDYNETIGLRYQLEWQWDSVEGIDGYKVYLDYEDDNIDSGYNYSISVRAAKILDTELDLWTEEN